MDPKQIIKDQAKQAIDREDFLAAQALIQALLAVSQTVAVSQSPYPAPTAVGAATIGVPVQTPPGKKPLVFTGPPPTDPEIPSDERPQATQFDLDRHVQMDEKDVRLHSK